MYTSRVFRIGTLSVALVALVALASGASAATIVTTPNGTWTAYPGQATSYQTSVQQPINADGSSTFKSGRAVIPVRFALSQGTGAFVFESIYSDNTSINDGGGTCGTGSGADHANDCAFLSFTPSTSVTFSDITELSALYAFTLGDCHGGSLRWTVYVIHNGVEQIMHIYYGTPNGPDQGCSGANSGTGQNLITTGITPNRFEMQGGWGVPGPVYTTYADAVASTNGGTDIVTGVQLTLDSGWGGDQRLTLTSATFATAVFTDTFVPAPASAFSPVCPTLQASILITKTDGTPTGDVNEPISIQPNDNNGIFRIVDCKYMYNLATSSLSGVGTYKLSATIKGVPVTTNPAVFDLK